MGSMNEVQWPPLTAVRIISKSSASYFQEFRQAHFLLIFTGLHSRSTFLARTERRVEPKDEVLNPRSRWRLLLALMRSVVTPSEPRHPNAKRTVLLKVRPSHFDAMALLRSAGAA